MTEIQKMDGRLINGNLDLFKTIDEDIIKNDVKKLKNFFKKYRDKIAEHTSPIVQLCESCASDCDKILVNSNESNIANLIKKLTYLKDVTVESTLYTLLTCTTIFERNINTLNQHGIPVIKDADESINPVPCDIKGQFEIPMPSFEDLPSPHSQGLGFVFGK